MQKSEFTDFYTKDFKLKLEKWSNSFFRKVPFLKNTLGKFKNVKVANCSSKMKWSNSCLKLLKKAWLLFRIKL